MITRILHVSDLHYGTRDPGVEGILTREIIEREPHVLVVTGDLINHGSWRAKAWHEARGWIERVEKEARERSGRELAIYVLPGNHDVLVSGLSGWCWLATQAFQRAFARWYQPGIRYHARERITFLTLDTNPRGAWFTAQGRAYRGRLRALKRALDTHAQADEIRASTKVLLMHHHVLPVPYGGSDWLLETRKADRLLQFVAENRIDLILHGHKHHATWSHLRVGGASTTQFFVEVLGAGAAYLGPQDYDRRGHNCNVIDIAPSGVRRVRQLFKENGKDRFEEASADAEELLSRAVLSRFRQPHRFARFMWRIEVDAQGDAQNELTYEGLVFNRKADPCELRLPADFLEGGRDLPYDHLKCRHKTVTATLEPREQNGEKWMAIRFTGALPDLPPAEVSVENLCFNSYALTQREAREWAFTDQKRDYTEYLLRDVVEELRIEMTFPNTFQFEDPRLEVREIVGEPEVHAEFTHRFQSCVQVPDGARNRLALVVRDPPANLRYRVSWALPEGMARPGEEGVAQARRTHFESYWLGFAGDNSGGGLAAVEAIITLFEHVWSVVDAQFHTIGLPSIDPDDTNALDLSFMVCQRTPPKPVLRMVFWSGETENPKFFREFQLSIGDGNAGRAYKSGVLRIYDQEVAQKNPRANTFKRLPGGPDHRMLVSIPLMDPQTEVPIGVVNVATAAEQHAHSLRALKPAHWAELASAIHELPLTQLLHAARLDL